MPLPMPSVSRVTSGTPNCNVEPPAKGLSPLRKHSAAKAPRQAGQSQSLSPRLAKASDSERETRATLPSRAPPEPQLEGIRLSQSRDGQGIPRCARAYADAAELPPFRQRSSRKSAATRRSTFIPRARSCDAIVSSIVRECSAESLGSSKPLPDHQTCRAWEPCEAPLGRKNLHPSSKLSVARKPLT